MDLDGDGIKDIISGSFPGEIFFFKGKGHGEFDAPVKLKSKNGKSINIGGGVRPGGDGMLLIAGDAKFEQKDGKQFIVYEGEWIEYKAGQRAGITGTASAVAVADLNGDGTLDLVVGDIDGQVHCILNEGTAKAWAFGKEQDMMAAGLAIKVSAQAGPCVADWDRDGKLDLLVGAGDGSVRFYRNAGQDDQTTKLPKFAEGRMLVPASPARYGADAPAEPTRGSRAKICVADWNGDGRPDLLVGDFATQKPVLPEPTAEQKAEYEKVRKQIAELEPKYREASQKYFDDRGKLSAEEQQALAKEFSRLSQEMSGLRSKLPREYENHGWVWVFTRRGAE